jgi:hypothetical protein
MSGTSLQGFFECTFNDVVAKFGEPIEGDGDKTTVEWVIKFEDGSVGTIYDYKAGQSPQYFPDDLYNWHIGGHSKKAYDNVSAVLFT